MIPVLARQRRLAFLGLCHIFDPKVLPKPRKKLKRLTHRNGIPLGQQGPGLIYNSRHLLFGDDLLVDELATERNEQGCACIRSLVGTEHEHESTSELLPRDNR